MPALRSLIAPPLLFALLLAGCGGHSPWTGSDPNNSAGAPSAPQELVANAGDGAVSLGWLTPATNGSNVLNYTIAITPTASAAQFTINGTTAIIRGLSNNTTYTFSVTATNAAGTGPAAPIQAKPLAAGTYSAVTITSEVDGIADPSLLRANNGRIWLTYSGVSVNNSGQILSSATRLAHSDDNGASYIYDDEIGKPKTATGLAATGLWQYRTPWLIEDSSDPNAARRFKLFAHKYFLNTLSNSFNYQQGIIVMWTAATPDGNWSEEQSLLGWSATPSILKPLPIVNDIDTALQSCLWVDDGGASIYNGGIDLVFSCATDNTTLVTQRKIVLLRSTDHLNSITYVATLLQPGDAALYDADALTFSAPALLSLASSAPVLITTPIDVNGNAGGCIVFPIANEQTGALFTANSVPLSLQTLLPASDESGGCTWDRGLLANGILMGDRMGTTYRLKATGKSL